MKKALNIFRIVLPLLAIVAVITGWIFIMDIVRTNQKTLALLAQAQQYAEQKQYQEAFASANQLIAQYPDSKQAISALDALVGWEAEFKKIIANEKKIEDLSAKAISSFLTGDFASAIAFAKDILAIDAQHEVATNILANSQTELAKAADRQYAKLIDNAQTLHFTNQWTQAVDIYQQALAIKYSKVTQTAINDCYNNLYLQKAQNARKLGNLKLAVDYYSKALQYQDSQTTRDSIAETSQLLEKISKDISLKERIDQLVNSAKTAQQNGDLQTAIEFYKETQTIVDNDAYKRSIDKCRLLIEEAKLLENDDAQILTVNIEDVSGSKTISEAIQKAKAGATVFIGKGKYTETFETTVPLTLIGLTTISRVTIEPTEQYILKAASDITVTNIDFDLNADTHTAAIELTAGKANIYSCNFQGGKTGILITEKTVCNIYDNTFQNHSSSAVSVKGEAVGKIENNQIQKCEIGINITGSDTNILVTDNECIENNIAISIADGARSMVKQNLCRLNSTAGIVVTDQLTKPTLLNNNCSKNADGIIVKNAASAFITANLCNDNSQNGIIVTGNNTNAIIDSNRINANRSNGISLTNKATARISGNLLRENQASGIFVSDVELLALIEMNRCLSNTDCGIKIAKGSMAEITSNLCRQNHYGILIEGTNTKPILTDNRCVENKYDGIKISAGAKPMIQNNTISENRYRGMTIVGFDTTPIVKNNHVTANTKTGIYIGDGANPTVTENTCSQNQYCGIEIQDPNTNPLIANNKCDKNVNSSGIYIYNGAAPTVQNNLCTLNEKNGISIGSQGTNPKILHNTCTKNSDSGILVYEAAAPTLKDNTCSKNDKIGIAFTSDCTEPKGNRWKKDNTTKNNGIEDFVEVTISPKE